MKECIKRYQLLNTYVNALSMEETIAEVEKIIQNREPVQHVVINAAKVNLMERDLELQRIVNACPLINADGVSIVWAAKQLGIPLEERVTGVDLFLNLAEVAAQKQYKVFLFGAKETVVRTVKQLFEEQYPEIQIVGYRNGYFTEEEEPQIVEMIRDSGADIVFVAISSPKKEYWINKHLSEMAVPFVMGVGGSFDVVAGVTNRAPRWVQKIGMEWFFRFIQEPRRMWKRYMIGNAQFLMLTFRAKREMRRTNKND